MQAGFSSLDSLKAFLLAEDLREQITYDEAITRLGLGVAAAFDRHCNRTFARAVGATWESPADVEHVVLPRYPVEAITTVQLRETIDAGWITLTGVVRNWDAASGLVWFAGRQAASPALLRITYTGGYWWDVDDGTTQPEGSTVLPEDVRTAWLLQCEAAWLAHDGLGSALAKSERPTAALLNQVALLPSVKEVLSGYIRYAIS